MNQESIFDEEDLVPEKPSGIYLWIGIFRLLMIFQFLHMAYSMLTSIIRIFDSNTDDITKTPFFIFTIIKVITLFPLLYFTLVYYFKQVQLELKLSSELFSNNKYRFISVIENFISIIVLFCYLLISIKYMSLSFLLISATIILFNHLPILNIDMNYLNRNSSLKESLENFKKDITNYFSISNW